MNEPDFTGLLVHPRDLVITPVADLAPDVRRRLSTQAGDVVLSRLAARVRASVIDAGTAELLAAFHSPTRIVDAVIQYSQRHGLDAKAMLIDAFPAFQVFVTDEFLVPADSLTQSPPSPLVVPGQRIGAAKVIRCIRYLSDMEVHEARLDNGRRAVLKIGSGDALHSLEREAEFLRRLGGRIAPALQGEFDVAGRHGLVLEWCPGTSASLYSASLRAKPSRVAQQSLLTLCRRVADAYATLHEEGVVHGDVHPENVIVGPRGDVRILDFGLARSTGEREGQALPSGAVWFFLAPERARRLQLGERLPGPTMRSEQYSVAALLYLLWNGQHYLDFSLEAKAVLTQVCNQPSRPFAMVSGPQSSGLEAALCHALQKEPRRRFANVRSLANQIRSVAEGAKVRSVVPPRSARFLADTLRACRLSGSLMRDLTPPTATVYYGAAGTAFALLRIARARRDPGLLSLSDAWCLLAERELGSQHGIENADLQISTLRTGRVTPFHTGVGVSIVRAAISRAFGDDAGVANARRAFVHRAQHPCRSPELTLGYAGVLTAGVALRALATADQESLNQLLDRVGNRLSRRLRQLGTPGRSPLTTLGMAHGWAGILYALLRWVRVRGGVPEPALMRHVDRLAQLRRVTVSGRRWPVHAGGAASMKGWCNGSAGMVLLWNEAAMVTGDSRFRVIAEQAARDCSTEDMSTSDLCCGLAGRAYSLLVLGRDTGDSEWTGHAQRLAERALHSRLAGIFPSSAHPASLFRGDLSLAMLLEELEQPVEASFPFLERL